METSKTLMEKILSPLTSLLGDSLVNQLALQESVLDQETSGGYGPTSFDSLAYLGPNGLSWKMFQGYLLPELEACLEIWPRSGMTRNGIAYQRPTLALNTKDSEYSLLPTLCARDYRYGSKRERTDRMRVTSSRGLDLPAELRYRGWNVAVRPDGAETFMGFPVGWTELDPSETP